MSYHRPFGAVPFSRSTAQAPRVVRPVQVAPVRATATAGQYAPRTTFAPVAQRSTDTMAPRPTQVAPIRTTATAGQYAPRTAFAPIAQSATGTMAPRPVQAATMSRASASAYAPPTPSATVRHTDYAGNYRPLRALPLVPSSAWFQTPRSAVTAVSVPFQPMPARRSVTAVTDLPFQPPAPPTGRRRGRGRRRRR